jgi:hypothetical protein
MYHHHNAGENHNINMVNKSLKIVATFTYLGLKDQNEIYEEMSRLHLGTACERSVENLLSFSLLS